MKKYSVFGNCQAGPIAELLNSCPQFSADYEYVPIKPVHTIDPHKEAFLLNEIADLDLLIYQPVVDERRFGPFISSNIVSLLGQSSIKVCVPPLYYGGYFPTFESIGWLNGPLRGVHDYFIIACFLNGLSESEALSLYSSGHPCKDTIKFQHKAFIDGLRHRESKFSVDIKVSEFIDAHFQSSLLFHTFNHPAPDMLGFLCNSILSFLGVSGEFELGGDQFSDLRLPITSRVKEALDLEFHERDAVFQGEEINFDELIRRSYEMYECAPVERLASELSAKKPFINKLFD